MAMCLIKQESKVDVHWDVSQLLAQYTTEVINAFLNSRCIHSSEWQHLRGAMIPRQNEDKLLVSVV